MNPAADAFPGHKDGHSLLAPDSVEQAAADQIDRVIPDEAYGRLPLVGLGGSAGSLAALQSFFQAMPADTGMAFVVVVHLSPDHESILPELLGRCTSMPARAAEDGVRLEANAIYVIPPGKYVGCMEGHLRVSELTPIQGTRVAVDMFFRTLADAHGPRAAAIVLSGADGDGAIGIKRIKERGGLTIAQDPEEAEHHGMPQSAIATGMVDWVLRVADMPARILAYQEREQKLVVPPEDGPQPAQVPKPTPDEGEAALRDVLTFLRMRTGRDFSTYKRATIVRRVARRLQINGLDNVPDYLAFLRTHPGECGALLQDLLISVTNFFRDRDCFSALELLIPQLFKGKGPQDTVRVWVPACATGEEAYSIAMLLFEQARRLEVAASIQIFACDLDESAIQVARAGLYPETIAGDVSEERLRRFFVKEARGWRVRRELRESVLFATHDLLKDSPFSRMDLISCRNLLIYFEPPAQERALNIFHFAMRPGGILFLGPSESAGDDSTRFQVLDKRHRLYRHIPGQRTRLLIPQEIGTLQRALEAQSRTQSQPVLPGRAFQNPESTGSALPRTHLPAPGQLTPSELHLRLLERNSPPSVLLSPEHEIAHVSENARRFFVLGAGEPNNHVLKLIDPRLRVDLRTAIFRAAQMGEAIQIGPIPFSSEGNPQAVTLRVSPALDVAPGYLLIVFEVGDEPSPGSTVAAASPSLAAGGANLEIVVLNLERQLDGAQQKLRETVEQYEAQDEEHKASNEELQAMNEELRTASEELETSREELQSMNEELTTVNAELKSKMEEVAMANSDMHNLMASTAIPTVFLDRELRIMRYTPSAEGLFRLIPGDIGRHLSDLRHQLQYPELNADAARVLEARVTFEREVRDEGGRHFLAKLLPYRNLEDQIRGVVLTLIDVTDLKRAEEVRAFLAAIVSSSEDSIISINFDGKITSWNAAAERLYGYSADEALGKPLTMLTLPEDLAKVLQNIDRIKTSQEVAVFDSLRVHKDGHDMWLSVALSPVKNDRGQVIGVSTISRDVSARRAAEDALALSEEQFRRAVEDAPVPVIMHAEDGQVLQVSHAWTELTGYHPTDIPTLDAWLALAADTNGLNVHEQVALLFKGEARQICVDLEIATATGERRSWVFSASAPGTLRDGRRFIVGMALDVTDRRRAENAFRQSEERLRLIVENAREYAIVSLELDRRIASWNTGAQAILGYGEEEIIGTLGDVIFTPEDRATGAPEAESRTALSVGRAADERWHLRKDGTRFWGSGVMMAMHDSTGKAVGFVKIFRDKTAQLHAKEALEKSLAETEIARAEAERAAKAKDHFLAVLSHELRTPLTPVLMALASLIRNTKIPSNVQEVLAMIQRNIRLEAQLIDELLDQTRISQDKFQVDRELVDLHEIIRQAVEVATPDIQSKQQRLTTNLSATAPLLQGDAKRLQQVFWNLLKNAAKFTPVGGAISVTSTQLEKTSQAPRRLIVEVSDTGIGLDEDATQRIFHAFTQADDSITRRYGGLGLGLSISKAVVEGHGGTIKVSSRGRDQGATFRVELPTDPTDACSG